MSSVVSFRDENWMSLNEEVQEPFICKICINQGDSSTNSLFTSKFMIVLHLYNISGRDFILVQSFITYISIEHHCEGQEFHVFN